VKLIPKWGRHGFDGIACGKGACRGVDTRNRSQNKQVPNLNSHSQPN
jgi:hypothetical protein